MAGLDTSAIPLPTVLPPNHDDGAVLCIITWIFLGCSTAVLAGRLISKICVLRRFALDDGLMLLAWACTLVYSVTIQYSYHFGLGRHYEYLTLPRAVQTLRWAYISQAFTLVGPMCGRVSFTVYLVGIIGKARHGLRHPLWALAVLQVVFNVALVLTLYCACGTDMRRIMSVEATCYRPSPWSRFTLFVGSLNIATDAALTLAPSVLISRLNTTSRAKYAAIAMLSLSIVAMATSIWRTVEVDVLFSRDLDFAHNIVPYYVATAVEQNVIIITASIPTLGPLFKYIKRKYTTSQPATSNPSRQMSRDSDEIRHNLANALGMRMPNLGNSVTITAGPMARGGSQDSQEHILPLSDLSAIKTTTRTDVKVEHVGGDDDLTTFAPLRIKR